MGFMDLFVQRDPSDATVKPTKDGGFTHKGDSHPWRLVKTMKYWNNYERNGGTQEHPKGNRFSLVCIECGADKTVETIVHLTGQILEDYITARGWIQ